MNLARMFASVIGALALPMLVGVNPAWPADADLKEKKPVELGKRVGEENINIGTLQGIHPGAVWFTEYEKAFRVDVSVSKFPAPAAIDGKRISAWLLIRDGQALPVLQRPQGPLLEFHMAGGVSAHALFSFANVGGRKDLVGIAVMIDDALTIFPMPKP